MQEDVLLLSLPTSSRSPRSLPSLLMLLLLSLLPALLFEGLPDEETNIADMFSQFTRGACHCVGLNYAQSTPSFLPSLKGSMVLPIVAKHSTRKHHDRQP